MNLSQKISARMRQLQRREAARVLAEAEQRRPRDVGVMARSAAEYVRPVSPPVLARPRPAPTVPRAVASHQVACPSGHATVVPVHTTGLYEELVANLCTDCDTQLPAEWERGDVDHDHRQIMEAP